MSNNASLPIDVVPNSIPRVFVWKMLVSDFNGNRFKQEQQGSLPASVEKPVEELIVLVRKLNSENALLREENALLRGQLKKDTQSTPMPSSSRKR